MTRNLSHDNKIRIITLYQESYLQVQLAEKFNVNKSTISRLISKFNKNNTVLRKKGSRRPKLLDKSDIKFFKENIDINPKIESTKLSKEIKDEKNIKFSPRTIRRELCKNNLDGFISCKKTNTFR
ncbi:hypothetical protein A0H76_195 [Hepatospora eriocheir]|uniref:Insertion element IS150 protein InsJ-like helix-turn-helix domain-containing protein n=1 Tax=Hepatospora eriocheir TaxID=1081669 RepID=A0A1X0QEF6_9MICR|nr:hypothetical protein A0H76_195 [Hepatospora eriocheir]